MVKCEQCEKEINRKDAIKIVMLNTWYLCSWECVNEYSTEMLNIIDE